MKNLFLTDRNMDFYIFILLSLFCLFISSPSSSYADDIPLPPTLTLPNDVVAQDSQEKIPSSVPSLDDSKEVTIIQKKDAVVEEVRIKGKLRYAKITPTKGKPYYMYDSDGDGVLDATENDIKKANVNQWILMEW